MVPRISAVVLLVAGVLGFTVLQAGASDRVNAIAARSLYLNEAGHLRLTTSHGLTLNEKGTATGTIRGSIYIHLKLSSSSRVSAEVSIYPKGGSLTGHGSASYHVAGAYAVFSGTMSITRGTGGYAHAHASALRFTGTIQRKTDAVTVHVSGKLSV